MKYSIEISKIIEGSLKFDQVKVKNYTKLLIENLKNDNELKTAERLMKILENSGETSFASVSGQGNMMLPVDSESRTNLIDFVYPEDISMNLALSEINEKEIQNFILNYQHADKLNQMGIGITNSLLLYGPPGCGKTLCAKYIAKQLGMPLLIARLDSLISSYLGTTSKNIRTLFEFTQKTPCILFLDEFDAIAKARDDHNEMGELKRVVNSLLQNIDLMSKDSLLIAATNHEQMLDSAVWRRFDYRIKVDLPDVQAIKKITKSIIDDFLDLSDKELVEISMMFTGQSGALIDEILKKAIRNSIIRDENISKIHIYNEFFKYIGYNELDSTNLKEINLLKARYLREKSPKVFSYSVIADILKISKTQVSSFFSEE